MKWMCGLVGALVLWSVSASAQTVTATWDRNTDAYTVGYRLYYGTASGSYQWSLDVGNQVTAPVALSPGLYYFAVRAYNGANSEGPPSSEVAIDLRSPARVDCVGAWSTWVDTSGWSACVNGQQSKTQQSTFVVTTPAQNGGLVCEAPDGTVRTQTITQACSTPPPTCQQDPLDVTVTQWPASKKVAPQFTSDYPVVRWTYASRGQAVTAITFTDTRGCSKQVTR